MNQETESKVKLGLLVVIAVTVIFNAFQISSNKRPSYTTTPAVANNAISPVTKTAAPVVPTSINNTPTPSPVSNMQSTIMSFKVDNYDFGNVDQNSENSYTFDFVNSGTEVLQIETAKGSCGCTVPDWPKHPILPGESGVIKVTYRPGMKKGDQNNPVTITPNTSPTQTIIRTKAFVKEI